MSGWIDIHSHVLPLVDDGAESVEMALLMLRTAAEEGIEKIILTPHQKADRRCVTPEGILHRMKELQELAVKEHIPVRLYPGNEIFYRHGLPEPLEPLSDSSCRTYLCFSPRAMVTLASFTPSNRPIVAPIRFCRS